MTRGPVYWGAVGDRWQDGRAQALWRSHSDAVNVGLLAKWLPAEPVHRALKTDLFDEAAGAGLYGRLALAANRVIGMDIATTTARAAAARHGALIAVGADARRLPFGDEAFDLILSNSTLDHFESKADLAASLRELHRVLKTPGLLIITLDNRANPAVALRNAMPFSLLNRLRIVPYYVGVTCGPRGLRRMLGQAGFQVSEICAVLHCPRVVAVAAAGLVHKYADAGAQRRFLRSLMSFERLSRWPTRFVTGYFVAARASKR